MKIKNTTIAVYEYSELSNKAKERALSDWNEYNDDPLMQSHMINLLKEKLEERGIKYDTDSIDVFYSLSNSQGDGFMFEGELTWKKYTLYIKHQGHYSHSNSKSIEMQETDNLGFDIEGYEPKDEAEFEEVYQSICAEMEQIGYDEIEYQQSAESFEQACDANEYTFEIDGKMNNL